MMQRGPGLSTNPYPASARPLDPLGSLAAWRSVALALIEQLGGTAEVPKPGFALAEPRYTVGESPDGAKLRIVLQRQDQS